MTLEERIDRIEYLLHLIKPPDPVVLTHLNKPLSVGSLDMIVDDIASVHAGQRLLLGAKYGEIAIVVAVFPELRTARIQRGCHGTMPKHHNMGVSVSDATDVIAWHDARPIPVEAMPHERT